MCFVTAQQLMLHQLFNLTSLRTERKKENTNVEKHDLWLPNICFVGSESIAVQFGLHAISTAAFHSLFFTKSAESWKCWLIWKCLASLTITNNVSLAKLYCTWCSVQSFLLSVVYLNMSTSVEAKNVQKGDFSNKHRKQLNEICMFVVNKLKLKITG